MTKTERKTKESEEKSQVVLYRALILIWTNRGAKPSHLLDVQNWKRKEQSKFEGKLKMSRNYAGEKPYCKTGLPIVCTQF